MWQSKTPIQRRLWSEMSMPHNAMRHTPPYSCLQVSAEKGQSHSMSRLIPELEATCYPSMCFITFIQIRSAQLGLPTGLDHISTRLTTYNRSHIPLYGALHGPITWQPDCPGTWPHKVNSYWYIAGHPWSCHPGSTLKWKTGSHED